MQYSISEQGSENQEADSQGIDSFYPNSSPRFNRYYSFTEGQVVEVSKHGGPSRHAKITKVESNGTFSVRYFYSGVNGKDPGEEESDISVIDIKQSMQTHPDNTVVFLIQSNKHRGNVVVRILRYLGDLMYAVQYIDTAEEIVVHAQYFRASPASSPRIPLDPNRASTAESDIAAIHRMRANAMPSSPSAGDVGSQKVPKSYVGSVYKQFINGIQGTKPPPSYSYFDVEDAIGERVQVDRSNRLSNNALDILALYIKGQKLLYTEAKTYCEQQLNFLMLPAIFISCVSSIFSFVSKQFGRGDLIMASLSGFNAFLLAVISYLKLDAKAQAHKTSAYKFDKLESMCEFNSGKFLFFAEDSALILNVVNDIEKEVKEIKETNQFILPESIRYEFTNTYSTNVFLMVKKLQHTESTETQTLSFTIQMLKNLYEGLPNISNQAERDVMMQRITAKEKKRDECIFAIIKCREKYFRMDEAFNEEIEKHISRSNRWFITRLICCDWLKS
jgi:hypothetical protein